MRRLLNCAAALLAIDLMAQTVGGTWARADALGTDPKPLIAGRVPAPTTTPRPTSARGAAIGAAEFPADPKNFDRHHRPSRPARRGAAHTILSRPARANRIPRPPGKRGTEPHVRPGALDPRTAPKNVGAIVIAYMARHPATPAPSPTPVTLSHRRGAMTPGAKRTATIDITQQSVTGINHWWSYEEGSIPGVGRWMVNAYFGNLIVQADDMDVPHRGIDLAFRRTYNSFSRHDFAGTDGATEIGQYGSGWTNTWDAHLSTNGCPNTGYSWAGFYGFSVHDVDGARYDYCFNSAGQLIPPTGMQGTTLVANPDGGSFYWTKKNGTQYTFYAPYYSGTLAAYSGRIYRISGRNQNNYIQFTYAWNPDASSSASLTNIYAATDNGGAQATLTFATFNGQQLLSQLARPDGLAITYDYDTAGELISVSKPPPNNSGTPAVETYNGYQSFLMVAGPRWNAGSTNDGGYVAFYMDETTTAQVDGIEWVGIMNFMPSDGTSTLLQPSVAPGPITYRWEDVRVTPTYTSFSDTDGHSVVQYLDGVGRPTSRQEYTGSQWLQTMAGWDVNNNLVSSIDERGNETDYAYDVDGNTVASAAPPPTPGVSRPTSLYSYDARDNILAYCDPVAVHAMQADWVSPPAAPPPGQGGLCPTQSTAAARYQWAATSDEPFGELTAVIAPGTPAAPSGYQKSYAYAAGPQGGADYGLPTSVTGTAMPQNDARTPVRQPQQSFWYDANGNLVCYGTGNGQWLLGYDSLGRLTSSADPDDSASGSGVCGKTGTQAGWNTTNRTSYFPDGAIASKQTASQVANGISTSFTYDPDGNLTTETRHHGCITVSNCVAGITQKIYDGADRLVEVLQPNDGWDVQSYPWGTRYIYDLSQGGTTSYRGMGLAGYGNLVSTQELLSGTVWQPNFQTTYTIGTGSWTDVRATAFDALDREVASYEAAFGDQAKERRTYDAGSQAGLLSSVRLATNEVKQYTYDGLGRQTDTNYSGDGGVTPGMHVTLDADGRVLASGTDVLGTETMQYDGAGSLLSVTEPASVGGAVISYDYYPDGKRQDLKYVGGGYSYTPLLQYGYRNDGQRDVLQLNNGTSFQWTYTAAGREQSQSDPLTGSTIHPDETYDGGGSHQYPYYPSSLTYAPRTLTYDTYGRLTHLGLPESLLSYDFAAAQYDLEDSPNAETANRYSQSHAGVGSNVPVVSCLPTTVRNEQMSKRPPFIQANGCSSVVPSRIDYNGTVLPAVNVHDLNSQPAWTLDARAGLLLNDQATTQNGNIVASAYMHDTSGRLIQDSEGTEPLCPVGLSPVPNARCYTNGTKQKTYDAENRQRSETYTYPNPNTGSSTSYGMTLPGGYWLSSTPGYQPANIQSVDYSAGSHPTRFTLYHPDYAGYPYANEVRAWLWDGNERLLACQLVNSQCTAPSFSLEGLGDYNPASGGIAINDRDLEGVVVTAHDRVAFRNWIDSMGSAFVLVPGNANDVCSSGSAAICNPPHDGKLTADGWTLDNDTWQGVRTYDATAGQWNTPDAYEGDVHDPMSQKPFMWNRNNPYQYSDPTGYASRPNPIEVIRQILERVKAGKYPTKPGASGGDSAYRPFPKKMNESLKGGGECAACGSTDQPLQGDHVVARSKGGNATPENHQKLCGVFCNPSKGDKSDWDWIARLAEKLMPGPAPLPNFGEDDAKLSDGEQALWDALFGKRPPPPKPHAPPGRK